MKTFNIHNIYAGWFNFSFDNLTSWDISYLSDVKDQLDFVFDLKEDENKSITLDMESLGDLLIQTYRQYDHIFISIIEMDITPIKFISFRFDYKAFITDYITAMETHKYDYMNKFIDDDLDCFEWGNVNYFNLKHLSDYKLTKEGVLMNTENKVYLAGPLFTREEQNQRKYDVAYLREHFPDWLFFSPLEVELSLDDAEVTNAESTHDFYYNQDMTAIHNSTLAIIDLSNDDNGTLVELGLIKGLEIPYIIINSDFRLCETGGMHRNSFVRGIEKEALLVAKNIEEVVEFLKER